MNRALTHLPCYCALAALLLITTGLLPIKGSSALEIGLIENAGWRVLGAPPGEVADRVSAGDAVFADERLETAADSFARVRFDDGSQFRMAQRSFAVLDRFVFDPNATTGEVVLNLTRGLFRFISGRLRLGSYLIKTPTLAIGLRGTDLLIEVLEDGATTITVLDGEVVLTLVAGGDFVVAAPDTVYVAPGDFPAPLEERLSIESGL